MDESRVLATTDDARDNLRGLGLAISKSETGVDATLLASGMESCKAVADPVNR